MVLDFHVCVHAYVHASGHAHAYAHACMLDKPSLALFVGVGGDLGGRPGRAGGQESALLCTVGIGVGRWAEGLDESVYPCLQT